MDKEIPIDQLFDRNTNVPLCMILVMFVQGLSHNMTFAHLEDLYYDFDEDPRTRASLGSAFLAANGIANLFWGQFCDRYGQKAGILACLFLQGVGSAIMAMAPTLTWAIAGRVLCGLSSNVTLTRAYTGRTTSGPNQNRAFSWIIGSFGAAVSSVPLCAWIPDQNEIGPNSASVTFGVVSMMSWMTLVLCVLLLPYLEPAARRRVAVEAPRRPPIRSWADLSRRIGDVGRAISRNRLAVLTAFGYSAVTFLLQAPDHVIITQTVQRRALRWLFSIQGFSRMMWTLFVYPSLCRRYSVVTVCKVSLILTMICIPGVPLTAKIESPNVRITAEIAVFALRGITLSMGITSAAVLVNNASPPELRTTIVGLSQSSASLSQTANVAFLAALMASTGSQIIVYGFLNVVAIIATIIVWFIPPSLHQPLYGEAKKVDLAVPEDVLVDTGKPQLNADDRQ